MKRSFLLILLVPLFIGFGCDSSSTIGTQQAIYEMQWLPDGSGLLAVVNTKSTDLTTGGYSFDAGLYSVHGDGSLGDRFNTADHGVPLGYPTIIAISQDGRRAITELGTTVYRVDIATGGVITILKNEYLMGVSASLKYALVTETSASLNTRFASIYDISIIPARRVKDFTMNGVKGVRALWIGDTAFAVWGNDSSYRDETQIFDTTGKVVRTFSGVVVADLKSAYAPQAGALFLYNLSYGIDRVDLASGAKTTVLANDSIEFMDVTSSGNLIAYSSGSGSNPFGLFALNPATGNRKNIGSNAYEVALAPAGDKVAYSTVENGNPGVNIHVLPISIP